IGTRFLIPAAPFWSLAIAIDLMRSPPVLMLLAIAEAVACWPNVVDLYCAPYAWRFGEIPARAALRIEPEDAYLSRRLSQYPMNRMVERSVPPDGIIFSMGQVAQAYTSRQILVKFLSAQNEVLSDILLSAIYKDFQPVRLFTFRIPERTAPKIRVVQTAATRN